jgi:hypothetical protein
MDSQQKNGQAIIICKQCGYEFSCGSDAKSGKCWCHDLPNVMPLTEQARTSERLLLSAMPGRNNFQKNNYKAMKHVIAGDGHGTHCLNGPVTGERSLSNLKESKCIT